MTALDYVFRVLKIESKTRKILREEGVTDVDSLLEIEEELRNEGQLNLKAVQRKKLILYLDWSVSFEKEHRREPDPLNDFSADVYNDFKRERRTHKIDSQSTKENALILSMQNPGYYNLILTLLLSPQASMVKEDMLRIDEAYKNGFTSWFVGEIQSLMPSQLVDACSHFESKYIRFIEKFAERRFLTKEKESSSGEKSSFDPFLVGGRTQSGKTSFKAVCALTCNKMQLPLVIITKGVAESKELYAKLKDFLGDLAVSEYLVTPSRGQPRDYMKFTLHKFGVIVVADTAPQINRAADAVSEYLDSDPTKRFAVIVDECDDMYRTTGRTQKTEQAYDRLMAMDPIMKLMISATLVPLIVNMKNENETVGWFEFIEPLDDYASIEDMKVFTDADGKQVFLSGRELSLTSHEDIPYCNEKALSFYRYAVNSPGVKGTLVLDVTCPRVNAEGNIFDKAERIQHIHNQIIVVAIYGGGIRYKTDIDKEWERAEKGMCIGEVLERLDVEYGLEWPIFVFGFSKMQRGMSFRSNQRVPSHILLSLGDGYSTEGMIQALGRATFNGKHILRTNGFQNVTVLTRDRDWDAARAYQHFLVNIARKVKAKKLDEAFSEEFGWKSNFLHGNKRKCGKSKEFRAALEDICFEDAPSDDDEVLEMRCGELHAQEALMHNEDANAIYDVVVKCARKYPCISKRSVRVRTEEILEEYIDYTDEKMTKSKLKRQLNWLHTSGFLKKFKGEYDDEWEVTCKGGSTRMSKKQRRNDHHRTPQEVSI